jgi:hypothetical protein
MICDPGDIILISLSFSDLRITIKRPVLALKSQTRTRI